MSKLVREIAGAALIVIGVVTGNFQLIITGALILGSAVLTPGAQNRQAAAQSLQLGEVARQLLLGLTVAAGSLIDAFNYGGKYSTDWEVLVIGIADHECEQLVGFYVNDVYVPFTAVGDDIADHDGEIPGYNGQLRVNWYPGTETQIVKQTLIDYGGWSADDKLVGIAHIVVHYKADDEKAKHPIWTAGRPRFTWVVKGAKLYDPRKDSTVAGGSGTHRWTDPSTWEWSDNPIVGRYNWVRGIFACNRVDQLDQLLVGRGLSAIEAPPENVAWRANICDELVALAAGGSERRYTFSGLINANEQYLATEERFAAAVAGVIKQPEGSVEVDPGHAVTPSFAITDTDFLIDAKKTFSAFRSKADGQWVNTVVPRYTEPTLKWVEHAAPIRRVFDDVLADGGARELALALPDVTSGTHAQRCAEISRRMGRLPRTGSGTLAPRFVGIEEGDWGVWTSARHMAGVPMTVRAEAISVDPKWQTTPQLREIAASVFAWTIADELAEGSVATPNTVPTYGGPPDAGDWSIAGGIVAGTNGEAIPAIILTGTSSDAYAQSIIVEYRRQDVIEQEDGTPFENEDNSGTPLDSEESGNDWIAEPSLPAATTSYTIRGLSAGGAYEVAISYYVRGAVSDRLVLGPVVAGALGGSRASYEIRTLDPAFPITPGDTSFTIAAFTAVLDDGRSMMFPAATVSGLASGTTYGLFWNLSTGAYEADLTPALSRRASANYVFLEFYTTSTAGVFPGVDPAPPGYLGGGPREMNQPI